MKIKKFYAADMRRAIKKVKDQLGPEAVILSSRQVDGRSEIVAAINMQPEPEQIKSKESPKARPKAPVPKRHVPKRHEPVISLDEQRWKQPAASKKVNHEDLPKAFQDSAYELQPDPYDNPVLSEIQRELREMRGLIQEQVDHWAWGQFSQEQPVKAQILRRLTEMGFTIELARRVVMAIPDGLKSSQAWNDALVGLSHRVRCTEDEILDHGGVIALAGSSGGGKTTTVAKLAARYAMRHGKEKVAIVCADQYRIGARAQLQTFAQIMGVSLYTAVDGAELREQLSQMAGKTLVLVDLPASRAASQSLDPAIEFMAGVPTAKTYLVESATIQAAVFEKVIDKLSSLRLAGVVVTRLDEAVSLGEILSVCIDHELKVAYVADGPRVPEDLRLARSSKLVVKSVELARRNSTHLVEKTARAPAISGLKG